LVYSGRNRHRGSAGTRTQLSRRQLLYRQPRSLYRQRSLGVIDGTRARAVVLQAGVTAVGFELDPDRAFCC